TGNGPGNFTLSGSDNESFTGGTSFTGVRNIKVVLKQGDDTLTVTNANLAGTLTVLGGSGNNTFNLDAQGGAANNTLGNLSVTNLDDQDIFRVFNGTNTITGNVTIRNGVGGSSTQFGSFPSDITTIGGTVSVTNLDGGDSFAFAGVSVNITGSLTINNGSGGSSTTIGAQDNTVGGTLSITNGVRNDGLEVIG